MTHPTPLLPLFPLEVVLFPGARLPLHIFEPRYRKLIHDCLQEQTEFGVVWMQDNHLAGVGCTARILEVTRRYDDGRMDIVTEGRRRFVILYQNREEEVLRGSVDFFDDEGAEDAGTVKELARQVRDLYTKIILALAEPNAPLSLVEEESPRLAFAVAGQLGLPLEESQRLLALRSEGGRLRQLFQFFEEVLPKMERLQRAKYKAGGNGHLT